MDEISVVQIKTDINFFTLIIILDFIIVPIPLSYKIEMFFTVFIKIANRIMRKYSQILSVSQEIAKELSIDADVTINDAYSMDMQDISMIVKSAIVYPENKIKIVLIDGTHMTIRV